MLKIKILVVFANPRHTPPSLRLETEDPVIQEAIRQSCSCENQVRQHPGLNALLDVFYDTCRGEHSVSWWQETGSNANLVVSPLNGIS